MTITTIVENILKRFEHGITIDDHKKSFNRLIQEINIFIEINNTEDLSIEMSGFIVKVQTLINTISNVARINNEEYRNSEFESEILLLKGNEQDIIKEEANLRGAIIELSTLQKQLNNSQKSYTKNNEKLLENIALYLNRADWSGSENEIVVAQAITKTCFFGLRNGFIKFHDGSSIILHLISTFSPKDWFSSGRVIFGTSFLLRSLLLLCKSDYREEFIGYTNSVCERLLFKVEIKQEKIFNFSGYKPYHIPPILEQMRFNLLMLEISSIFDDLRFLNAALKSNDRVYRYFRILKISVNSTNNNIQNILSAIYYTLGIKMQEDLFDVAFNGK